MNDFDLTTEAQRTQRGVLFIDYLLLVYHETQSRITRTRYL